jgi:hypothetical protein
MENHIFNDIPQMDPSKFSVLSTLCLINNYIHSTLLAHTGRVPAAGGMPDMCPSDNAVLSIPLISCI